MDTRFAKIEKTVEKIHNEFKLKQFNDTVENKSPNNLFSHIIGNNINSNGYLNTNNNFNEQVEIDEKLEKNQVSLSLVLAKEMPVDVKPGETEWNDVILKYP